MKTKHIKVISFIITVIFIIAIVQLLFGIFTNQHKGAQKADDSFNMLMVKISNAAAKYEPGSPEFSSAFMGIMNSSTDIAQLRLRLDGMQMYEYPSTAPHLDETQVQTYSSSTRTAQGRTLSVEVMIYAVHPDVVSYHLKIAFVLILAGTIVAVILLMYLRIEHSYATLSDFVETDDEQRKKLEAEDEKKAAKGDSEAAPVEVQAAQEEPEQKALEMHKAAKPVTLQPEVADAIVHEPAPAAPAPQAEPEPEPVTEEPYAEQEQDFEEPVPPAEYDETIAEESYEPPAEEEFIPPTVPPEEPQETQTAVPPTKISLAMSLEDEIGDMLSAATKVEEDLSVLIIKPKTALATEKEDIQSYLREKIGAMGITGEWKDTIVCAIKNTSLETALAASEALRNELKHESFIGISSRANRAIPAARLLSEAMQAAEHATDEAPVIAFRVDPEKYRKFIQENS